MTSSKQSFFQKCLVWIDSMIVTCDIMSVAWLWTGTVRHQCDCEMTQRDNVMIVTIVTSGQVTCPQQHNACDLTWHDNFVVVTQLWQNNCNLVRSHSLNEIMIVIWHDMMILSSWRNCDLVRSHPLNDESQPNPRRGRRDDGIVQNGTVALHVLLRLTVDLQKSKNLDFFYLLPRWRKGLP